MPVQIPSPKSFQTLSAKLNDQADSYITAVLKDFELGRTRSYVSVENEAVAMIIKNRFYDAGYRIENEHHWKGDQREPTPTWMFYIVLPPI